MKRVHRKNYYEKLPRNTKLVALSSRWGNRFNDDNLTLSLARYEIWLQGKLREEPAFLEPLRGFNLACYCPLDQSCHVDILLEFLSKTRSNKCEICSIYTTDGAFYPSITGKKNKRGNVLKHFLCNYCAEDCGRKK